MNIESNRLTFEAIMSLRKKLEEATTGMQKADIMGSLICLYASTDFAELAELMADLKNVEPIRKKKAA